MTTLASATSPSYRVAGRAAIASGVVGFISFSVLIAYLFTAPQEVLESEVVDRSAIPLLSSVLLRSSDVGSILQVLFIVPAVVMLHAISRQRAPRLSQAAMTVGVISLCAVALLRVLALLFAERVSGILFMGPTAFIGIWLIVVNGFLARTLPKGLRVTGAVAGIGLVIQGASFFFLGGLDVLTEGPLAYADDVDFHNWNAIGGVPGGILFWIWAILLGISVPLATRRNVA